MKLAIAQSWGDKADIASSLATMHKMFDKCIVIAERKMAAIPTLKLVAPTNKKRTVGRKANAKCD
jgi:hypothetical protein